MGNPTEIEKREISLMVNKKVPKEIIKKIFNLLGLEIKLLKNSDNIENHLKQVLEFYQIDLVIDVGANKGQFGKMLRNYGYKGEILSFEPVSATFNALTKTSKKDTKWRLKKIGLGDKKEQKEINVFDISEFSSLLSINNYGKEAFKHVGNRWQETIEIDTLDNILSEEGLISNKRIFLKMDTQGYDLRVFRGAQKSLKNIIGILSEMSFIPIYDNMPNYKEALVEFEQSGFRISGLYPVNRDKDLTMIEMDCVMLKKNSKILI